MKNIKIKFDITHQAWDHNVRLTSEGSENRKFCEYRIADWDINRMQDKEGISVYNLVSVERNIQEIISDLDRQYLEPAEDDVPQFVKENIIDDIREMATLLAKRSVQEKKSEIKKRQRQEEIERNKREQEETQRLQEEERRRKTNKVDIFAPEPKEEKRQFSMSKELENSLNEKLENEKAQSQYKPKEKISHPSLYKMLSLARIGQNILMVGPTGSGKTYLSSEIANMLGRDFSSVSCCAGMSESWLSGWLLPIKENGTFDYVPSGFVEMYENGGVFLFDEMDAGDENTLIFINAALAGDCFHLPQRFHNRKVKRHKNFVALAAANTFGNGENDIYSGRNQLDGATLDRFRAGVIEVDYSEELERKKVHPEILRWGWFVRHCIKVGSINKAMSTRVMIDFTKQKEECGFSIVDFNKSYFADWTNEEIRQVQNTTGSLDIVGRMV